MSDARATVLARVRAALGSDPQIPEIPRDYAPAGSDARAGADAVVERFAERVADYRATVHRCDDAQLAGLLAGLLAGARVVATPAQAALLEQESTFGHQEVDKSTPAPGAEAAAVVRDDPALDHAALDALDAVLTGCAVAIAETGTIVLDGGPESGRRAITLIPDHHVCVVDADRVVAGVPDAIAALRPAVDAGRPLTLISGPSATSDIELERVEGVHGPRRLDVVIVTVPTSGR